jgi:predicted Rossmann-fold nucleotide-binding protein
MGAVSRAFAEVPDRRGSVLGIVPAAGPDTPTVPKPGYPNEWVEIPIYTHLHLSGRHGEEPLSRNHLVVLTSAVIIALPGGPGTASELRLALKYGRPVIAYLKWCGEIEGMPDGVRVEPDLEQVKEFVLRELSRSPLRAV